MGQTGTIDVTSCDTPTGGRRITLAGRIDVGRVTELHRAAVKLARQAHDVVICCGAAEYLHPAVVQVVIGLGRELDAGGRRCELTGVRGPVRDDLVLLGLGHVLTGD
ncbi:STAS domain-containing protein [Limnoglobus roseus]|uniref:STAS domain-containing protein n=1 Tax=Limnoglobus roseus TaxID=2598579 RepID=A0A5C1AMX8_9BACT|nr:STAS domain-containing protein [Limnoglobus roseus]QEL20591.1 STAS domain-containing protein [Limnoglobus roseus]